MDIFISYSSRYWEVTAALAEALQAESLSVWWDKDLDAYDTFRAQIDAALSAARVVVVIWSNGAAASDYVIAEARQALTSGRLVNLLAPGFDPKDIPKPFGEYQAEKVENIDAVVRAILRRWRGERPEKLDAAAFYERATGKPALSPKQEPLSSVAHVTPALLLNARLALAPYLDVHGLRQGFAAWAQEGRPLRGRLVHGPGGLGKTRLMAEVCSDLRQQDWAAGFVETPLAPDEEMHRLAIEALIDTDRQTGLMLVLDYAERRQEEAARYAGLMARAAAKRPDRKLRLVLLARSAGEWWDRAVEESAELQAGFSELDTVLQLTPFEAASEREHLFLEATAGFRQAISRIRAEAPDAFAGWGDLSEKPIPEQIRSELSSDAYARPLMIQIAALLSLQGDTPEATSVAALLDGMLGLERKYWRTAIGAAFTEPRKAALNRGSIQTTLAGGVTRPEAEALLLGDAFFGRKAPAEAAEPLADLGRFYGTQAGALMALEPDLVGEHLAAADGDERLVDACLDWAGEEEPRRRMILTVLNRASRGEHGTKAARARRLLEHVLHTRGAALAKDLITVALETPGDLAGLIEGAATTLDLETSQALHGHCPDQTLRLADMACVLAGRLVELARPRAAAEDEDGLSDLAMSLNNLGARLSELGRREDALAATQEAADIRRTLAAARPDAFLPDLA
ncbi:TIR domain-containing protein, partial [Hyphomonas sp.]|uniref:TIR domain-containing protein n=1 Tax=Hyphomonas sp. TaxID=87 RepID=UPI003918E884